MESERIWGNLKLRDRRGVGTIGRGRKVHALHVSEVVGVVDESQAKPGNYDGVFLRQQRHPIPAMREAPIYFSVQAACNANGQHTAQVRAMSEKSITCGSCRRRLGLDD